MHVDNKQPVANTNDFFARNVNREPKCFSQFEGGVLIQNGFVMN